MTIDKSAPSAGQTGAGEIGGGQTGGGQTGGGQTGEGQMGDDGSAPPTPARMVKLILEYDGRDFHGWQVQPETRTVQGVLADAIGEVTGVRVVPVGAGRTDAGVHARGQVANFATDTRIPAYGLLRALNKRLPRDVAVVAAEDVDPGFSARFSARGKWYRYRFLDSRVPSPLDERGAYRTRQSLDVDRMAAAGAFMVGRRDFRAFAKAKEERSTVRTLFSVDSIREGRIVCVDVRGDGFFHNMVRVIAGTLYEVGRGRRDPAWVGEVLARSERADAGPTLPGRGLCMMEVYYGRLPQSATLRETS